VVHLTAVRNLFCTQVRFVCTVTASVRPSVMLRTSETNNDSGKVCIHKLLALGRTEHDRRPTLLLRAMGTYRGKHHSIMTPFLGYGESLTIFLLIVAHILLHADTSCVCVCVCVCVWYQNVDH
jgi:hypothetical protein